MHATPPSWAISTCSPVTSRAISCMHRESLPHTRRNGRNGLGMKSARLFCSRRGTCCALHVYGMNACQRVAGVACRHVTLKWLFPRRSSLCFLRHHITQKMGGSASTLDADEVEALRKVSGCTCKDAMSVFMWASISN